MNLAAVLLGRVPAPDRIALREPTRSCTYTQLSDRVRRVAGALTALGLARGDRAAVLMPDGLEAVESILGILHAGGIVVPLSELGRANDVRALVRDAGASVALVHASLAPVLDEVRRELPTLREVVVVGGARGTERSFEELVTQAAPVEAVPMGDEEPAFLLYTAGPADAGAKGVVHSHGSPLAAFEAFGRGVLGLGPDDRVFSASRLASAYGLGAGLIFPLAAGAESILLPEQPHSRSVFELVSGSSPTVVFATPSLYGQLLVDAPDEVEPIFAGVRICVAGAEALPPALAEQLAVRLGAVLCSGYGLTEAFHFVLAAAPGKNGRGDALAGAAAGSVGVVVPGFEARLVDGEGRVVGDDDIGTLEVKGPSLALGYWSAERAAIDALPGEWLHTGDRFLRDPGGRYFHSGRTDGLFKVGGHWVSPTEVEATLLAHEAVWECAVVGAQDEHGLTRPLAYVVPNVGYAPDRALEEALIEYVKQELAPYKFPRWIEFIGELPKGPQGAVLRYKLTHAKPRRRRPATVPPG